MQHLSTMPDILLNVMVFGVGLCIGSFLNVCIYRIPLAKSLVHPGSACPKCGNVIRFYDNIPVLSWLWLGGRCRHCHGAISLRYPLIELLSGVLALCVVLRFRLTPEAAVYYGLMAVLVVITFIDMDYRIIPDVISLPGIPIGFLASFALPSMTWKTSLLGILAGGGTLYLVAAGYYLLTKRDGMGGGDIKLMAMMGAVIGWEGVCFTIFAASTIGTLVGMIVMLLTRKNMKLALPFGPFLSIGAAAYVFIGNELIQWYFKF